MIWTKKLPPDGAEPTHFGVVSRYQPVALLARGGMADVHLVVSHGPHGFNKLIVVKRLRFIDDEEGRSIDMFLDEARLAARLKHPHIVDTYDVGQDAESYFITMEYLDGQSLGRLLRVTRDRDIHPGVWVRIACDALRGLDYAHELEDFDGTKLQIVHRDVSPPNIFVTYGGQVKIVDFGIAKATLNLNHTQAGTLKGKFAYMAPEQAASQPLDRRADLFSMGVVLWEAIARRRLLEGNVQAMLGKLLACDFTSLASVRPDIDPRLSQIVGRALKKAPDERYSSAAEMHEALAGYLLTVPERVRSFDIGKWVSDLFTAERALLQEQLGQHLAAGSGPQKEAAFLSGFSTGAAPGETGVTRADGSAEPADGKKSLSFRQPNTGPLSHSMPTSASISRPVTVGRRALAYAALLLIAALGIGLSLKPWQNRDQTPALRSIPRLATPQAASGLGAESSALAGQTQAPAPGSSDARAERLPTVHVPYAQSLIPRVALQRPAKSNDLRTRSGLAVASSLVSSASSLAPGATPSAASRVPAATESTLNPAQPADVPAEPRAPPTQAVVPPGTLTERAVAAAIRPHAGEIQACFERARMDRADLHGRLTVRATIDPRGRVLSASPATGLEGGARLSECVLSAFRSWLFPAPAAGVSGHVSYSFVFE